MNKMILRLLSGRPLNHMLKAAAERPVSQKKLDGLLRNAEYEPLSALMMRKDLFSFIRMERAMFEQPEAVQETVLMEMVRASENTVFGREHQFEEIRTVQDFRERVPLSEWSDYEAYSERLMSGESDVLFPGNAVFFYRTSGSTSANKEIPESRREETARKAIAQARVLERILTTSLSSILKSFAFFERADKEETESGIPIGSASGRTMNMNASRISKRLAYSPGLVDELSGEALLYTIMRCTLVFDDVTAILGNNAWMMQRLVDLAQAQAEEIIEDIRKGTNKYPLSDSLQEQEKAALRPNPRRADHLEKLFRTGRLIPKYYWPELRVASFWLGGTVGVFADRIRPLLPEKTVFLDVGYGASEAKINIPMCPDTSAGPLSVFTSFFEFLPEDGSEPILAHQLEDGKVYEIILTTYGGLYRYQIKDLVRVDGFTGRTPNICFLSRNGDCGNLAQERVPGALLLDVIRKAAAEASCGLRAAQVYPDPEKLRYRVCVETDTEVSDCRALRTLIEDMLCEEHYGYSFCHEMFNPMSLVLMKGGWLEHLMEEHTKSGATGTHVKLPVMLKHMPEEEWIREEILA